MPPPARYTAKLRWLDLQRTGMIKGVTELTKYFESKLNSGLLGKLAGTTASVDPRVSRPNTAAHQNRRTMLQDAFQQIMGRPHASVDAALPVDREAAIDAAEMGEADGIDELIGDAEVVGIDDLDEGAYDEGAVEVEPLVSGFYDLQCSKCTKSWTMPSFYREIFARDGAKPFVCNTARPGIRCNA